MLGSNWQSSSAFFPPLLFSIPLENWSNVVLSYPLCHLLWSPKPVICTYCETSVTKYGQGCTWKTVVLLHFLLMLSLQRVGTLGDQMEVGLLRWLGHKQPVLFSPSSSPPPSLYCKWDVQLNLLLPSQIVSSKSHTSLLVTCKFHLLVFSFSPKVWPLTFA